MKESNTKCYRYVDFKKGVYSHDFLLKFLKRLFIFEYNVPPTTLNIKSHTYHNKYIFSNALYVSSGREYQLYTTVENYASGAPVTVQLYQVSSNSADELLSEYTVDRAEEVVLNVTATTNANFKLVYTTMGAKNAKFNVSAIKLIEYDEVQDSYVSWICNEDEVGGKDYRFGFNGMHKDNEIKGIGNSLDFGARIYDSRLGRWLSLDKKGSKYPMDAPYMFAGNNPICIIDPDGNEKIIVSASDNHDNTFKFLNSAFRQMGDYKNSSETKTLMLINNNGFYSKDVIDGLVLAGKKQGFAIIEVENMDEAISYINGSMRSAHGNIRPNDLVSNVDVFSHGTTSTIHADYASPGNTVLDNSNYTSLDPNAFARNALFISYACRTGASIDLPKDNSPVYHSDQVLLNGANNSLAQGISDHLGIQVNAFMARTEYSNILGTNYFERKNNEKIGIKIPNSGGVLRPAVNPVTGATGTGLVNPSKYKFTPRSTPQKL